MAAGINDKISKVSSGVRPVSTTVSTIRNSGATTLACADLTGWTTTEVVFFVTYKIDGAGDVIPGSQSDWKGIVSGSNINNLTLTGGTDAGNAPSDIVEMLPTAEYAKQLAENVLGHANQDGTLKSSAVTAALAGTTLPNNTVATASITDSVITYAKLLSTIFSGQVQTQTNTGNIGGTMNYINLGGIKLLWMDSNSFNVAGSTVFSGYTIIPPTSFFTTAPKVIASVGTATNNLIAVRGYAKTTSLVTLTAQNTAGGAGDITASVFMIGA